LLLPFLLSSLLITCAGSQAAVMERRSRFRRARSALSRAAAAHEGGARGSPPAMR